VLQNAGVLSLGQIIMMSSMMLWTAIIARYVGPENYGLYAYAQATVSILVIFVNLGLDRLVARDVAQQPQLAGQYLTTFLLIKCAMAIIVLGGFVIFVLLRGLTGHEAEIMIIVTINWFVICLYSLANSVLHAHQAMHYVVVGQAGNSLLTLGSGAAAVALHESFAVILLLSLSATLVQMVLAFWFSMRFVGLFCANREFLLLPGRTVGALLRRSAPFAGLMLITVMYSNMVLLLLRELSSDVKTVGYFAAAQRIQSMTLVVPEVLLWAIFPAFSDAYGRSPARFAAMFERAYRYLLFVTVPMAVGLWVVGPEVLAAVFGPEFRPAGNTLRILSLVLATAVGYVLGPAMAAMDRQKWEMILYGAAMIGAAVAGYWAIPRYGAEGAAWAVVAGMVFSRAVYSVLVFRWLELWYPAAWVLKTLVASIIMGWVASLAVQSVHFLVVSLVLGPAVYGVTHLVLGTLQPNDWDYLTQLLPATVRRAVVPASQRAA